MAGDIRNRKVAVTGATGMVGSHVVAELVRSGYTDIVLPIRNPRKLNNLQKTFALTGVPYDASMLHIVETELTDSEKLTAAFEGVAAVFNCAAKVTTEGGDTQALIENNRTIARNTVDCALKSGVERFLHVSSISALGDPREGETLIDEECAVLHPEEFSPYGQSKQAAEKEIWRGASEGLQVTVVLPAVILGEGDWYGSGSSAMIPLIAKGLPVTTCGVVGYVDVRDVARAMRILYETEGSVGEKFILSADNLSYRELMSLGAKAAGRHKPLMSVGRNAMMTAYGVSALLKKLHVTDTGLTKMAARSATSKDLYDGTKIKRYCAFDYSPLSGTIDRVVTAYLNEKRSKE